MSAGPDPVRERWQAAGAGWRKRADEIRAMGMPVSAWMIEQAHLQPGHTVLELAAGPGDTGFMAAELVRPAGRLICSDAVEAMLDIARDRAIAQGIDNVEFKLLDLEWIDRETASVDAILCRWGLMFATDMEGAAREMRRVLRPGGRVALAAWDSPERNPWASLPGRVLIELGHAEPPNPSAPNMFALAEPGRLTSLLQDAGFTEVEVEPIDLTRTQDGVEAWLGQTLDVARPFAEAWERMDEAQRGAVVEALRERSAPFAAADGTLRLTSTALAAAASA